jgi:hypothetical protein
LALLTAIGRSISSGSMNGQAHAAIYPNRASRQIGAGASRADTGSMEARERSHPTTSISIALAAWLILAACAAGAPPATWTMTSPNPSSPAASMSTDPVAQAAWQARPAFVREDAQTEAAYAFALANPQILAWIPCYCGCGAMGHRSNLDCFIVPGDGRSLRFEEHASYCAVCVNEALMAKQLAADGKTLRQIRLAIDASFGSGGAPGTDTAMPAA